MRSAASAASCRAELAQAFPACVWPAGADPTSERWNRSPFRIGRTLRVCGRRSSALRRCAAAVRRWRPRSHGRVCTNPRLRALRMHRRHRRRQSAHARPCVGSGEVRGEPTAAVRASQALARTSPASARRASAGSARGQRARSRACFRRSTRRWLPRYHRRCAGHLHGPVRCHPSRGCARCRCCLSPPCCQLPHRRPDRPVRRHTHPRCFCSERQHCPH
mmetsp:Transcript_522/g.2001  ORF Transcript_522/g.2001 Transcript_522/m.2001 type:complete len:219 (-) Transcript_522:342-998(-)